MKSEAFTELHKAIHLLSTSLAVSICALGLAGCGKAVVVLQNDAVQKALGNVLATGVVLAIEKAVDAFSGTAHASTLQGTAIAASQADGARAPDLERDAKIARLSKLELSRAMQEQAGWKSSTTDGGTYTCQRGATRDRCIADLQEALSKYVEARTAALQTAFVQCRDQAAASPSGSADLVAASDAINMCVSARGFKDEVFALNPNFRQRGGPG